MVRQLLSMHYLPRRQLDKNSAWIVYQLSFDSMRVHLASSRKLAGLIDSFHGNRVPSVHDEGTTLECIAARLFRMYITGAHLLDCLKGINLAQTASVLLAWFDGLALLSNLISRSHSRHMYTYLQLLQFSMHTMQHHDLLQQFELKRTK
eukprot:6456810-Amphidinium_carterae.1